jgi:hypothetical protein
LNQVDPDIQTNILNYELSVDLLVNMPDSEVLDVFSRLNSYAVILNEQEKLNAAHFGPFKTLADRIAHSLNEFWIANRILTEQQILRMGDITLTADLLIAMTSSIKSKKQIKSSYTEFEKVFDYDSDNLEERFMHIVGIIRDIFSDRLRQSEFRRIHVFYSLFTTFYHVKYGIPGMAASIDTLTHENYARIAMQLEQVETIFATEDITELSREEMKFLEDCRRATTDGPVRLRRTEFLLSLLQ